jgi:hypothetical protein
MGPSTTANGQRRASEKARAFSSGKTVASTRATGKMIKPMDKEDLSMLTGIASSESGLTTRLMEGELMSIWTVQIT